MAKYYIKKYKDALVNERNLVYPEYRKIKTLKKGQVTGL